MLTIRDMQTDGVREVWVDPRPMGNEDHAAWWHRMSMASGITIAGLTESKPVHPARLLAELAEEFDRGIGI